MRKDVAFTSEPASSANPATSHHTIKEVTEQVAGILYRHAGSRDIAAAVVQTVLGTMDGSNVLHDENGTIYMRAFINGDPQVRMELRGIAGMGGACVGVFPRTPSGRPDLWSQPADEYSVEKMDERLDQYFHARVEQSQACWRAGEAQRRADECKAEEIIASDKLKQARAYFK